MIVDVHGYVCASASTTCMYVYSPTFVMVLCPHCTYLYSVFHGLVFYKWSNTLCM